MAQYAQHDIFHHTETNSILMAVIEHRPIGGHEWKIWLIYDDFHETTDRYLSGKCGELARRHPENEWKFRYGYLVLKPSDKCETFKSE